MARIVFTTVGSTGDIMPQVALARALGARGHEVSVASHLFHAPVVEAAEVPFVPVGAPLTREDFNRLVDRAARLSAPLHQFDVMLRGLFLAEPQKQLADLSAAVQPADLVVCQRFDYIGQEAAIRRGVPWASVTLAPQLIRTQLAPVYPAANLARIINELTWMALEQMAEPMNRHINQVLTRLGSSPRTLQVAGAQSPYLDLVPVSPHLAPRRADWPDTVLMAGAWLIDAPNYQPEPRLADFLQAHPLPVVITFGSMGGSDPKASAELILGALQRLGRPAIVQHGYSDLLVQADLPKHILSVGAVPHDYLFSRAGCVVHHAGAGTSAAVARAGVPSVPVPHLFDQYYWAGMLHERGVAPKPVFRHQLDAKKLAELVRAALHPKIREAARQLATKVQAERGLDVAMQRLEALIEAKGAGAPA